MLNHEICRGCRATYPYLLYPYLLSLFVTYPYLFVSEYRQLYFKVEEQLIKAENTANQALVLIENCIDNSDNNLGDMRRKAAHLPDGTAIFRDSSTGDIYTENGTHLAADEILNIQIPKDAPTWIDYKIAMQKNQLLHTHQAQIQSDQRNIIAPIRQRLNDQGNPPSEDELKDMLIKLEKIEVSHDAIIMDISNHQQPQPSNTLSAAKDILGKSPINGPPVCSVFNDVRSDNSCQEASTPDEPENNKDTVRFDIPDL